MKKISSHLIAAYVLLSSFAHATLIDNSVNDEHMKNYTPGEISLIEKDLDAIEDLTFEKSKSEDQPIYLATAGGPGSAKSTILETFLKNHGLDYAYIDPDRQTMRFMIHTYIPDMSLSHAAEYTDYNDLLKVGYTKWRGGSNYIANTLLNRATDESYSIAHGTTSTSPHMETLYKNLKNKGYKIHLILCGASDDTRLNLVNYRETVQASVQSDPNDVINKGKMFPERFKTYFEYADKIYIYWTSSNPKSSVCAAEYTKQDGLIIHDATAFEEFIKTHGPLPIAIPS